MQPNHLCFVESHQTFPENNLNKMTLVGIRVNMSCIYFSF